MVNSQEFLASLIDASVDGIVASDMQGAIVLFNRGAERLYGYKAEDVIGKLHVSKLYPDGVAKDIMRRLRASEQHGEARVQRIRLEALTSTGARVPMTLSAAMIYENGKPVATFGIFTDLRELVSAEERLAQVQQKLAVSEKQALVAELAGTAAHELNQPLTSVMGYAELLKRRFAPGTPEAQTVETLVRECERIADVVRKLGKVTKYETKTYVGQQRILDLDRSISESLPPPPKTPSKASELYSDPEIEEHMIQTQKLATLGQFAAGILHELNNPLTSISVYSDYLLKKAEQQKADEKDIEKLRRIADSSQRILMLTRSLVTYARPAVEPPGLLSIHEVLDEAVVFCDHVISEHNTLIEKKYTARLPLVFGIRGQLHQVFINLITNACQAMTHGKGRITLASEKTSDDVVGIKISDTGEGIETKMLERIFDPFFSTKSQDKGTGLGLSIVRTLVQQHHGTIRVTSTPAVGTSFEITLPTKKPEPT